MPHDALTHEVLTLIDQMEGRDVTDWEANFLESLLRQDRPLSPKQHAVLVRMAEQYLPPTFAAELRGQQRLL
jgi:hypothetical protein